MAYIIVIDDDAELLGAMRRTLEDRGHWVRSAEDGLQGMELIERSPPDLVVTDIIMPEKEGIETIVELGERYPKLPVMAISGASSYNGGMNAEESLLDAELLGARGTLSKPFSMNDFVVHVEEILARR